MTAYYFGSYQLNNASNGVGTIVLSKSLDLPVVEPVSYPIARRDGFHKSGEQVKPRDIPIELMVVGSSRSDLLARLDALQQALSQRSQQLIIHDSGTRSFQSVDCVSGPLSLAPGNVVYATCKALFRCYDPYEYSTTLSTYDTGTVVLTSANSLWNFPAINVTGGGTYYSYPLLHIINKSSTGSTTLSAGLTSGNNYTSISVAATTFSAQIGDKITITHGTTVQTLNVTAAFSVGATSIAVTSFTASASYISGDACAKVSQWTSISITQVQDSQTLTANSSTVVPLPNQSADYVDIQCDPAPVQGWTIQTNSSGKFSDPLGIFPVIETGTTTFTIAIACASAVSAEAILSWKARWLS